MYSFYLPCQDTEQPSDFLILLRQAAQQTSPVFAGQLDLPAIARLFEAADYVGLYAHPSLEPNFDLRDLEISTRQFSEEMKIGFGVDIDGLFSRQVFVQHQPLIAIRNHGWSRE